MILTIIWQLPYLFLPFGDFNIKRPLWECNNTTNQCGKLKANLVLEESIVLFNECVALTTIFRPTLFPPLTCHNAQLMP